MKFINVSIQSKHTEDKPLPTNFSIELPKGYITVITANDNTDILSLSKTITSPHKIYDGDIYFDDIDISNNRNYWLNRLGYISDNNVFFKDLTINQNINIYATMYETFDKSSFLKDIKVLNVNENSYIRNLSRGEFIKFQIAFAIAHNAKVLLFEDALAGLDIVFKKELLNYVSNLLLDDNISVVFICKNIEDLEDKADYIYVFDNGNLSTMKVGEY